MKGKRIRWKTDEERVIANMHSVIKTRCTNPKRKNYDRYKGKLADYWLYDKMSFVRYILDVVGKRPSDKHTLDRIDNDRGYEVGNLRWATPTEQNRNKTTNRHITAFGITMIAIEWAETMHMSKKILSVRLNKLGYSNERALMRKINGKQFTRGQIEFAKLHNIDLEKYKK